jgi:hypothetical protein
MRRKLRLRVVSIADHIDEAVHIDVDKVGKVVELIGGGRMAPVQHVHLAAGFG